MHWRELLVPGLDELLASVGVRTLVSTIKMVRRERKDGKTYLALVGGRTLPS
jgi:hypothetical protein